MMFAPSQNFVQIMLFTSRLFNILSVTILKAKRSFVKRDWFIGISLFESYTLVLSFTRVVEQWQIFSANYQGKMGKLGEYHQIMGEQIEKGIPLRTGSKATNAGERALYTLPTSSQRRLGDDKTTNRLRLLCKEKSTTTILE